MLPKQMLDLIIGYDLIVDLIIREIEKKSQKVLQIYLSGKIIAPTMFTLIKISFTKSSLISFTVPNAPCNIPIGDDQCSLVFLNGWLAIGSLVI